MLISAKTNTQPSITLKQPSLHYSKTAIFVSAVNLPRKKPAHCKPIHKFSAYVPEIDPMKKS